MMKRITSFKTLLSMLAMVVMGSTVAVAENKVYISDFSIAAGDEVDIAINFDTDATDIRGIEGTITLPAGLTAGDNAMKADDTRAAGLVTNYKRSNGFLKLRGVGSVITGTTGAVAYLKVKADASLAATSIIKLSSFEIEHSDGTKEDATTANATVTCTSATPSVNTLVADPTEIGLFAGGEAEFTVSLNNEDAITGLQATLELPLGVTATVTKSDRLTGAIWQYNATTGAIKYWGASALAGNEGAVFTVKLTADDTFTTPKCSFQPRERSLRIYEPDIRTQYDLFTQAILPSIRGIQPQIHIPLLLRRQGVHERSSIASQAGSVPHDPFGIISYSHDLIIKKKR